MENQLTTIEKMPIAEMMQVAKLFAESGMFSDAKSQAQAMVKILAGQEIGIPPFASMSGIHIIVGKPSIGAGLIAARVKGSGKYDYKVTEQTDKSCSIDFYQGKDKIGTSAFSIEDANHMKKPTKKQLRDLAAAMERLNVASFYEVKGNKLAVKYARFEYQIDRGNSYNMMHEEISAAKSIFVLILAESL